MQASNLKILGCYSSSLWDRLSLTMMFRFSLCPAVSLLSRSSDFLLLSVDNNVFLYGVFDGHSGCKVSGYAAQNLPAEILLDQLKGKTTDKEMKEVLYQVNRLNFSTYSFVFDPYYAMCLGLYIGRDLGMVVSVHCVRKVAGSNLTLAAT